MSDNRSVYGYELEPSEESLTRICEAHWYKSGSGVKFIDIHQHDACNHTLSGTIDVGGVEYGFIIDNGNWAGTVVRAWGDPEDVGVYDPGPPPEMATFVPVDDSLSETSPGLFNVYLAWRKESWFVEKERGYNYDRHFAPGGKTESYYRDWAAKKGMKIGYLSHISETRRKS